RFRNDLKRHERFQPRVHRGGGLGIWSYITYNDLGLIIFTSQNYIYSWGSALQELSKFQPFQLFNTNIAIIEKDIQYLYDRHEKQSLQMTIRYEFQEYLNKIATLAEWACGVDLMLGTYLPLDVVGRVNWQAEHGNNQHVKFQHMD
ncbi:unnamed protein product, partial [Rotaria socialis]